MERITSSSRQGTRGENRCFVAGARPRGLDQVSSTDHTRQPREGCRIGCLRLKTTFLATAVFYSDSGIRCRETGLFARSHAQSGHDLPAAFSYAIASISRQAIFSVLVACLRLGDDRGYR